MNRRRPNCQCPKCSSCESIVRDGFYFRRDDSRKIQRFKCKNCSHKFSNASFSPAYKQKKRRVNHSLLILFASGMSKRRVAIVKKLNRKTVDRKFEFLGKLCREKNQKWLKEYFGEKPAIEVQFDDLITIEHTKLKPVSVSSVVEKHSRKILGTKVSQIGANGKLAEISVKKYGKRFNNHRQKLNELFAEVKPLIHPRATFESDEHSTYPRVVRTHYPGAIHIRYKGGRSCIAGQGELKKLAWDPLFSINHTYAMFRANINRLFRRTWNTTKKLDQLQNHLDIYTYAFNTDLISSK